MRPLVTAHLRRMEHQKQKSMQQEHTVQAFYSTVQYSVLEAE